MHNQTHAGPVIPYRPRPLQALVHLERRRFTLLLTHRRFGKTVCAVCELLRRALLVGNSRRAWRAAYIAPYLTQAKSIAWDYLKYYAAPLPGVRFNETELRCDLPGGARIRLYGADNPDALRGLYFDDLVIDEAADVPRSVWTLVLRPTLADRQGWVMFTGTPKGVNNLLHDAYEQALSQPDDWRAYVFKASQTGYVSPAELHKAQEDMSEDEFAQEFECSFAAAVHGAYWAREIDALELQGRLLPIEHEPDLPVHTAWDLGMDDATSLWFFQVEPCGDWRILEYYENSGEGLEHYIRFVQAKAWRYGRHIAPHDIMVRELGTGKSRFEVARSLGITFTPCRNLPVMDGINAVRSRLKHCWFDATRCAEGIKALRQYRKSYNATMGIYGGPLHDWTSHPADAFRYAVIGMMSDDSAVPRQYSTVNKR